MFSTPPPHSSLRCLAVACFVLAAATSAAAQVVDAFNPGANGSVRAIAIQPDGKILVGGAFTGLGGGGTTTRNRIGRLNADGTVDTGFNPGANLPVHAIAIQPDGKIVVGGTFTGLGGGTGTTTRNRIGRLNADGTVDDTFNPGANNTVNAIAIQPDGKILVVGQFSGLGGGTGTTTRRGIGRLNADGTVDPSFDPGADRDTYTLAIQPDGKILVGGAFLMLGGGGTGTTARNFIGRLNADGTLDTGFNPGANNSVFAMAVQPDGRILVGGQFTGLGGGTGTTTRNRIGRLNADGTVDAVFNNPGANDVVYSVVLQADGRILVGGAFQGLSMGPSGNSRLRIGRLMPDGLLDDTFNPGATDAINPSGVVVYGIALQPDGRVLAGGTFSLLVSGASFGSRLNIGRFSNNIAATQSLTAAGTSIVTWSRGGASPELQWAEFAFSTDGLTYTDLGPGTRVAGGWQITGLSLPADPYLIIRARGVYGTGYLTGSGSIDERVVAPFATNLIQNGDFSTPVAPSSWVVFEEPDIVYNVTTGVFNFYRANPTTTASGQATIFQVTGQPVAANTPLRVQFDVGNSSTARKRISVLAIDSNFSDIAFCTFWLAPGAPLRTYTMRTHTTKDWSNAALYFYAATKGQDGGFYQLDNVSLQYDPAVSRSRTDCVDPTVPTPPGGADGPTLLTNGDFETGTLPPWGLFGQISGSVNGGVFEFIRVAGTPAGVVLQATSQAMTANQLLTASFDLGNSHLTARMRVTVLLHDNNFSDLAACTFWLAPGQPLSTYTVRTFATQAWANATVSIYPATMGPEQWIRLDNVTFRRTPGTTSVGTECVEPPPGLSAAPSAGGSKATAARHGAPGTAGGGAARAEGPGVRTDGSDVGWRAVARGDGAEVLYWTRPIDLTETAAARLTFPSMRSADGASIGELQVTVDGRTWHTVASVPDGDGWMSVDLAPFVGHVVYVRFVFRTGGPAGGWR